MGGYLNGSIRISESTGVSRPGSNLGQLALQTLGGGEVGPREGESDQKQAILNVLQFQPYCAASSNDSKVRTMEYSENASQILGVMNFFAEK